MAALHIGDDSLSPRETRRLRFPFATKWNTNGARRVAGANPNAAGQSTTQYRAEARETAQWHRDGCRSRAAEIYARHQQNRLVLPDWPRLPCESRLALAEIFGAKIRRHHDDAVGE